MEVEETPADDWVEQLNREFGPALERIAWAILRDWDLSADATQEAFLVLASKSEQIPPEHRRAWLVRTVQLQAHNLRRKQQRHQSHEAWVVDSTSLAGLHQQVCPLEQAEELSELQRAIDNLPPEQRAVLRARLVDEETFASIAERMAVPLGTVLSRMRLAIGRLRQQLRNEKNDDLPTDE